MEYEAIKLEAWKRLLDKKQKLSKTEKNIIWDMKTCKEEIMQIING